MALSDYYLCDICGGKTFYDASLNYEDGFGNPSTFHPWPCGVGSMAVLCEGCAKTHEVIVSAKP